MALFSLLLLALVAVGHVSCTSEAADGFIGLRDNDLYVEAPPGGRVFVAGVDVIAQKTELDTLKTRHEEQAQELDTQRQEIQTLKSNNKELREEYKAEVGVLQRVLCDAGLVDFVSVAQTIDTNGAFDWEHFEIDGVHFLALANEHSSNINIPSVIYEWNNTTKQFEQTHQSINTNGARDWEHFEIDGTHFLAVANFFNGHSYNIPSVIYKWNSNTTQLEPAQAIDTNGARYWEHFEIDGAHFLAVANFFNGNSYNIPSVIYKWNSNTTRFVEAQSINTNGAVGWEHFEIDGRHYLAVANAHNGNAWTLPSVIYEWNKIDRQFEQAQSITTNGAFDWEHFEIDGVHYLAVANLRTNAENFNIPSVIYRWNNNTKLFEPFQSISTKGAWDWKPFELHGAHFLAVANWRPYNTKSTVYQWNTNTNQFEEAQSIDTNGAMDWEYFEVDGRHYLAVANNYNGNTYSTRSFVYQLNPLCV